MCNPEGVHCNAATHRGNMQKRRARKKGNPMKRGGPERFRAAPARSSCFDFFRWSQSTMRSFTPSSVEERWGSAPSATR